MLVNGATAVIRRIENAEGRTAIRLRRFLDKKPAPVASVTIANKTPRMAWALILPEEDYMAPATG